MPANILLTGAPGAGKTTIVREVVGLIGRAAGGLYTEEVKRGGRRVGFDVITLDGRRAALSRVNNKSKHRVGKYGVDLEAIDSVAVPAVEDAIARNKIVIVDEIGKMELFSLAFRAVAVKTFDSPNPTLAVIMLGPNPFADSIKRRPDVKIIEVMRSRRDLLPRQIAQELTFSDGTTT